jgi:Uncharacterized protein conserved in bacteria (DUF2213)
MDQIERQIRLNLAADGLISTGLYNGEEHLIVPTVALLGDIVVFGLHAEFPELVPASELAFSLPSWAGRPVIPDHPPDGSANTPDRLDDFQYGQIFFPEFSDNRLRFEIWLSRSRAESAGCTWVIEELEAGNMVEISIGASIELERISGTNTAGEYYGGIWRNICGDHIAVGLSGGRGACNLDMGCGALRFMSESEMLEANMANQSQSSNTNPGSQSPNSRYVQRVAGAVNGSQSAKGADPKPSANPANEPPVSVLSALAARMGEMWNSVRNLIDDIGQSDWEIRSALADAVNHIEPGFSRVIDVFQDSMTFTYVCFEWSPDEKFYRRSFTKGASGVSVSDTREEVTFSNGWKTVLSGDSSTTTTVTASAPACGCQNRNHTPNPSPSQNSAVQLSEGEGEDDMANRDAILKRLAALSDEELEKLVQTPAATPAPTTVPATGTETPAPVAPPATTPAAPAQTTTPAPAASNGVPAASSDPANLSAAATAILAASGIDVPMLNAVLAGEKVRQAQLRESLITALSSRVPNLTREILTPQSTAQLEMMAQAAGIVNQPAALGLSADYSGLGMAVQPVALESGKKYTPPDPFGLHKTADKAAN